MSDESETFTSLQRIVPAVILIAVLGAFISLAIYAYQAGRQTVAEGELMIVEADDAPIKIAPDDPGGMQFPNQDKTIFETFGSTGNEPPKVERVLPTPEEPMDKNGTQTMTWIKEGDATKAKKKSEDVFAEEKATAESKVMNVREELGKQAVAAPVESVTSPAAKEPFTPEKVKAPTATSAAKAKPGNQMVQLGAFRSAEDAQAEFAKAQKKFGVLSDLTPTINRADLGDKGIFFRLRVATDDARALCAKLDGQACMVVRQ